MSPTRAVIFALALAAALTAAAETVDSLESLDQVLPAVATFEQGQSSGPAEAIEKFVFALPADSPTRGDVEKKLIDALEQAQTADAKRFLCTQLRVVGTATCVGAVAELLTEADVSHMAVYCLGRMEAPEAGAALRQALGRTSGNLQAGILNALGDRRDTEALGQCAELLKSDDATVAEAAARALGRIGTVEAAKPLLDARQAAPAALKMEIDNALLCAAELLTTEPPSKAVAIYTLFAAPSMSEPLRFAALRGMVQTTEPAVAADLLAKAITSDNPKQRRFAISLTTLVDGPEATKRFASAVASLDAEDQVILLRALGARADAAAAPALIAAAKHEDEAVRVAALEALGSAGNTDSLQSLATAAATYQGLGQKVARASLVKLPGNDIDARLLELSGAGDTPSRAEAIRALAGRGSTVATKTLLKAARDTDATVRSAAIEALGSLAAPIDLPAMVALAVSPVDAADRSAIAEAIGRLFYRIEAPSARSAPVLATYQDAPSEVQATLLAILAKSGSEEALAKVNSAIAAKDAVVRNAAVQSLADWPNTDAIGPLLALVGSISDSDQKEIALKGYVRLAEISDDPAATYLRVLKHVTTVNDRKRVLEGLGLNAESSEALGIALQYVDDKDLQATAGLAALRIAHRLRESHEQLAREALHKVIDKVDHDDVLARAQEVLNDLDKFEDHILQWVGIGPFTERGKDGGAIYQMAFAPEKGEAKDGDWKPITKGIGRWDINLESTYGGLDHCAAYLRTQVWSPKSQDALIELGSDDAVKVWLNGKQVSENWKNSGAAPRQERVAVKLDEGWNTLMIKAVDQAGGWQFGARIRQPDGTTLEGLKIEAR